MPHITSSQSPSSERRSSATSGGAALPAGPGVTLPGGATAARRRRLVGLVMSGAPLMMSLPTAVSAATVASAFRAALNDSALNPDKEAAATDGWLRIPAVKLVSISSPPTPSLYRIGLRFYQVGDGIEVFDVDESLFTRTDVFLLVLFTPDYGGPAASIGDGVPFPIRSAGQGLHQSAWASVSPGGTQSYDGVAWVS